MPSACVTHCAVRVARRGAARHGRGRGCMTPPRRGATRAATVLQRAERMSRICGPVGGWVRSVSKRGEGGQRDQNLVILFRRGKRHLLYTCTLLYHLLYHRGVPDALDLERNYISRGRRRSRVLYCGAPAHDDTR